MIQATTASPSPGAALVAGSVGGDSHAAILTCQRCGWVAVADGPGLVAHWKTHGGIPEPVIRYVLPLGMEARLPGWTRKGKVA